MERLYSTIIIKNLKNKTTRRMSLNFSKINKKIIIRQKSSLLSSYSNRNFKNNNILNLTPKSFNSEDNIQKDITNLLKHNLLTNKELRSRLISIKNERNVSSKIIKLKKNIFMNLSPIKLNQNEYQKFRYNNNFKGIEFADKTEKIFQDLRKIFNYNILPGKNENKYKFDRPKSYIEKDWKYSDEKENSCKENKYFSRSFLNATCSKNHITNNVMKLNKFMNEINFINSKENKIYKEIVRKSLFKRIKFFKKGNKKSNHLLKN